MERSISYTITQKDAPTLRDQAQLLFDNLKLCQAVEPPPDSGRWDSTTGEFFQGGKRYTITITDHGPGEPEVPG